MSGEDVEMVDVSEDLEMGEITFESKQVIGMYKLHRDEGFAYFPVDTTVSEWTEMAKKFLQQGKELKALVNKYFEFQTLCKSSVWTELNRINGIKKL